MKLLRNSVLTLLVVMAWVVVAEVADADLRSRQRDATAAQGAT